MAQSPAMNVMRAAVEKAGRALRRDFGEVENLQVSKKGPGDFVSQADLKAEKILFEELSEARPGYGFLMEERGVVEGADATHRWIVDPLDGTTNFLHGIPHLAISVALEREGTLVAGVIYNPITDELFFGERGQGAYGPGGRLRVAGRDRLSEAVLACGAPHGERKGRAEFLTETEKLLPNIAGLRRFGAASLDLAFVAAGRFDAFWERGLAAWDMAAGIVLVREAGGLVSDLTNRQKMLETGDVIAGNEFIHAALLKEL
ncbi:MAG: inositol monophosphatase [PS1 clade bacterium]|uniref:Inositol-1-monophosphatase n=1 Tax=PS1 clade bacterium TaxID=2175152 RepID=A0A937HMA3_9PROT|nr:inositol monophosphatase [PS1 clade bacterium]